jgi:hypothetical protein
LSGQTATTTSSATSSSTATGTTARNLPVLDTLSRFNGASADISLATALRERQQRELIRLNQELIEGDRRGAPMVRGELVAFAPADDALAEAQSRGFVIVREQRVAPLDIRIVVLRPPLSIGTSDALDALRRLDPAGTYDVNHIYLQSDGSPPGEIADARSTPTLIGREEGNARIGLIDSGVDTTHPVFAATQIVARGCGGATVPGTHGTAVASIMVGGAGAFRGVAPRSQLYAADIYCRQPTGGSATAIIDALAWLASEQVAVINVSLVGPHNTLLERAVATMIARGHIIVAAVGNEGPASPPLYPAAYPNVVAVTAVDAGQHVIPEAGRGMHVMFAAPGSDMAAATTSHRYRSVRGTSYAAPIVAAMLAYSLSAPDRNGALRAIDQLAKRAVDLGAPGWDPVYGLGMVGAQYRVSLAALQ